MGLYKTVTMFVILEYRPVEETILHWKSLAHLGDTEEDEVGGRDWKRGLGLRTLLVPAEGSGPVPNICTMLTALQLQS